MFNRPERNQDKDLRNVSIEEEPDGGFSVYLVNQKDSPKLKELSKKIARPNVNFKEKSSEEKRKETDPDDEPYKKTKHGNNYTNQSLKKQTMNIMDFWNKPYKLDVYSVKKKLNEVKRNKVRKSQLFSGGRNSIRPSGLSHIKTQEDSATNSKKSFGLGRSHEKIDQLKSPQGLNDQQKFFYSNKARKTPIKPSKGKLADILENVQSFSVPKKALKKPSENSPSNTDREKRKLVRVLTVSASKLPSQSMIAEEPSSKERSALNPASHPIPELTISNPVAAIRQKNNGSYSHRPEREVTEMSAQLSEYFGLAHLTTESSDSRRLPAIKKRVPWAKVKELENLELGWNRSSTHNQSRFSQSPSHKNSSLLSQRNQFPVQSSPLASKNQGSSLISRNYHSNSLLFEEEIRESQNPADLLKLSDIIEKCQEGLAIPFQSGILKRRLTEDTSLKSRRKQQKASLEVVEELREALKHKREMDDMGTCII